MQTLSRSLYSAEQIRAIERTAIESLGMPGYVLMQRAGWAAFQALAERLRREDRVLVLCGPGNNGGDGYEVARHLREAGYRVKVMSLTDPAPMTGDAASARDAWLLAGGCIERYAGELPEAEWIVDALLGTGLQRPLTGAFYEAVAQVNASGLPVLAIDVPSGLSSETGQPLGLAVRARLTVTFVGYKVGQFIGQGADHCGELRLEDLQVPAAAFAGQKPRAVLDDAESLSRWLPPRPVVCHKGDFGHVLVVGGQPGMSGAALMAAEAAARCGAGLVSVATHPAHAAWLANACPVVMVHGVKAALDLEPLLARATVIALGPGLGQSHWSRTLWQRVMDAPQPLVVDADALNLLVDCPVQGRNWILTPHPGEAARLLGCSSADVQADRLAALETLANRYGGVVVLKGHGTLVAADGDVSVCTAGNPGMASGGMGDVLTGVIAALLAQGLAPRLAARAGVVAHARAADLAAGSWPRGLIATDVIARLREVVNPC